MVTRLSPQPSQVSREAIHARRKIPWLFNVDMAAELKDFAPYLGVALGSGLNETSQALKYRRERRRYVGKLIEHILGVRQRFKTLKFVV